MNIWMNRKYVRMTIFVNVFIESATKKSYRIDIKCHRTLNIICSVLAKCNNTRSKRVACLTSAHGKPGFKAYI